MSETYKGLRKRRKRTHPSKCPCCITDHEGEPENEGSAGSESHNEVIVRQSRRKKTTKKKEDENKSDSELSELNSTSSPTEKPPAKKRKLRNTSEESPDISKDLTKKVSKGVSSKNKDKNSKQKTVEKTKARKAVNSKNANDTNVKKDYKSTKKVSKTQLHDSNEEYESDREDDEVVSKVSKSKTNNNGTKRKKIENNGKSKVASKSKTNGPTKKEISDTEITSQENDNQIARSAKSKAKKTVTRSLLRGRTVPRRLPVEKPSLAVNKTSQGKVKSLPASMITQTKVMVFDNLHQKLKSAYRNKDLTVEEAAAMLTNISSGTLHVALKSSERTGSTEEGVSIFSRNQNNSSQNERRGISDTEEIVSQAAEALVSFRSKSPLTREDSTADKPAPFTQGLNITSSAPQSTWQTAEKPKPQATTVTLNSSPAVQALMAVQPPSSFPSQVFTPVTTSLQPNILHGVFPSVSLPQSFPQLLPSSITSTFTNLMPTGSSHGTLPSFSQIAAHLRPPAMTSGVQPALMNPGLPNPTMPTASAMLTNQALLQPQLQQPPLPNPITSSKPTLTTVATMKSTAQPVEQPKAGKPNTQAQNPLQQPLKGMEEVVGNVGSNIPPPYVLNIKSPVTVFLGSPQNLGGVPRNLMANPGNVPTVTSEQSGYPPVAPRPVSKSETFRVNPGNASSVANALTLGGRPILPRTQVQGGDDGKRVQSIAPQAVLPQVPQPSVLNSSSPYTVTTSSLPGQVALTQVTSTNLKKPTLMTVNIPVTTSRMGPSLPNFMQQNIQENPVAESSSATSAAAKQAVKKLVHERTKSAELRREASGLSNPTSKLKAILPLPPKDSTTLPGITTSNPETGAKNNEFNIEQAATALLSIGVPDGIETIGLKQNTSESSKEDHEEDVVFTSKGMFRVGDVDVDPRYNRIGREGYTCGKCNKIFTSLSYLARHIKRVCPDMSCRKWKCTLCDKAFRHPFGLQQHVYTHTGERPHKCPLCPKAFYSSNDLRRHSRIHSGERPYRCKHCDKSFATTISLKTHTYIHTGEKPHKCPQCPKTFATSSKLGRHIVTHSEQRPFSCDQCPKSFNRSGDLRRHNLAVHDGKEKSFDCDLCPATFSKPAGLRRHNTTLHQKPPKTMECDDCGTQFSTPICLKMHRDTYHKNPSTTTTADTDKAFTCDVCGRMYSSAALLIKHKATHEPSSTPGYNPSQFQHIAPKPVEQTAVESGS